MSVAQYLSLTLLSAGSRRLQLGMTAGDRWVKLAFSACKGCTRNPHFCSTAQKFSYTIGRYTGQFSSTFRHGRQRLSDGVVEKSTSSWRCSVPSIRLPHPHSEIHRQVPSHGYQHARYLSSLACQCNVLREASTKSSVVFTKRNVGRSKNHNDASNTINKKINERTRYYLKGRVSRLTTSFSQQNFKKLKDKFNAEQPKTPNVGRLRGKLHAAKKEDVRTIPNLLTTLRMASAPVLAYFVVSESFGLACSLFVLAGITDMLDGYIARNFKNQRTALGTALDPLADKLLVSFLTISLTSVNLIPLPLTALIVSRDVGLIAATFYVRYISLAPPRTLSRYFDVSHVTAKLYPSTISKVNTVLQLSFVASTLASPVFDFVGHPLLQGLMYATAATTFLSGADYVLTWRRRLKIIKNN